MCKIIMHDTAIYDAKKYWEERLANSPAEIGTGAGHISRYLGPRYNKWIYRARVRALQRITERFEVKYSSVSILEIGCGTGFWTRYFADRGVTSYVGIDIAKICVELLSIKYPQYSLIQIDASLKEEYFEKQCNVFDLVVAFDVLYHITADSGFDTALTNACYAVKPNGLLLVTDLYNELYNNFHVKHRPLSAYDKILKREGLIIESVLPVFFLLNRAVGYPTGNVLAKLITYIVLPLYYRGILTPILYWLDGYLVGVIGNNRQDSTSKMLVARRIYA